MIESAMVFDLNGEVLHWHLPVGRSAAHIPDSHNLWEIIWENRDQIGGVAHTHPGNGLAHPSHEDRTTFSAIELALGKRLIWPILTGTDEGHFVWVGPGKYNYSRLDAPSIVLREGGKLQRLSQR